MTSKTKPVTFFRQVRAEMAKVTWPVRREVGISTVMVLIMVILAAMFFFLADVIIKFVITGGIELLSGLFQSGL